MEKKTFILKIEQLMFLKENITNKQISFILDNSFEKGKVIVKGYLTNKYQVNLSRDEQSMLLDELTLLFTSLGLQANDEPNMFGEKIEELIDVFAN